jgi:hypothetical protein
MSNLVPSSDDDSSLEPKVGSPEVSPLDVFITQQEVDLSKTKDLEETKKRIEILKQAIEVSKMEIERQKSAIELRSEIFAEELEFKKRAFYMRSEIEKLEFKKQEFRIRSEIEETRYKNLSFRIKATLSILSIPTSIAIGFYLYIFLNRPDLGMAMIMFGFSGAALTFTKEEITSFILSVLDAKNNK